MLNSWKRCSVWAVVVMVFALSFSVQGQNLSGVSCAVFPDQILGQANVGYAGAANVGYAGALGDEVRANQLELDAAALVAQFQYATVGTVPVALIVVDDFGSDQPLESADWASASHGWYVLEVVNQLLAALPAAAQNLITVQTLDVAVQSDFRSDLIAANLEAMIADLQAQGIQRVVVNMSFVFVRCETGNFSFRRFTDSRAANPNHTLVAELGGNLDQVRGYLSDRNLARLDAQGGGQGAPPADVRQRLQFMSLFEIAEMNSDPLRTLFSRASGVTVVPVASAGNFKWRRPFFPAQWTEVLSVSATQGSGNALWSLSNNGTVSAAGAYFLFPDDVYRGGTSFAAPLVSLMIAVDMTNQTPLCAVQSNGRIELVNPGRYENTGLMQAAASRCR